MWKKWTALSLCILMFCFGITMGFAAEAGAVTASDYSDPANWLAIPEITKEVDTF